jgi:glycerate dehydrogenase
MSVSIMKAAFIDFDTVSSNDLDTSSLRSAVDELHVHNIDEPKALEMMQGMQAVLLNKVRLTRELMERSPQLKIVALAATGTDNVDLAAARERGIAVCNVTDYCTQSVAQHVFGLLLTLNQHVLDFDRMSRDGSWNRDEAGTVLARPIRELHGLTFGVIGWGNLGRGTARIAEAFGMRILIAARPGGEIQPGRVPLDDLLSRSDVISLHCPLTPATRGLIGTRALALM